MSKADRERWEERYRNAQRTDDPAPSASIAWLGWAEGIAPVALDLACGLGRNTRALADMGYRVIAADISRSALLALARNAPPRAAPSVVQIDADTWPFAPSSFDAIVQVDFLDRRLFDDLRASVKPEGLLLVDTFAGPAGPNDPGPRCAEYRLEYGELRRRFTDWSILRYIEDPPPLGRATMLARRPADGRPLR